MEFAAARRQGVFELATGLGVDRDALAGYGFICDAWRPGDAIWLFGFSRGAYTARVIAALIHMVGVLPADQRNLAGHALRAYKLVSDSVGPAEVAAFKDVSRIGRVAGSHPARIRFLGLWDTVSSVIVPGRAGFLQRLPFARVNPAVEIVRHAAAIDEVRRMFRLNRWIEDQPYQANPYRPQEKTSQDVRQVWFAGAHGDVGGGHKDAESGLSRIALAWMVREALTHGLRLMDNRVQRYVYGVGDEAGAAPDHRGPIHPSLDSFWPLFEYLPRSARLRETRPETGWPIYLPRGEPRRMALDDKKPLIHQSVVDRVRDVPGYRPPNLPDNCPVET